MTNKYIPDRNDIIYIDFQPQTGQEQDGRRPALVLSPKRYNKLGLAILVPITTGVGRNNTGAFKVALPDNLDIQGTVISDQVKSLDWKTRNAKKHSSIPNHITTDVLARLETLLS